MVGQQLVQGVLDLIFLEGSPPAAVNLPRLPFASNPIRLSDTSPRVFDERIVPFVAFNAVGTGVGERR